MYATQKSQDPALNIVAIPPVWSIGNHLQPSLSVVAGVPLVFRPTHQPRTRKTPASWPSAAPRTVRAESVLAQQGLSDRPLIRAAHPGPEHRHFVAALRTPATTR